jgi:hypothetical protein
MSLSRYPRTPSPSSGLSWTGDNTGAITPSITGGQAVEVRFDDFTGDNLFIGDGQWPYLALAQINGSTTLTNIRVPAMLGVKKFYLTTCTQANMTVTGAALSWLIFDSCGCANVNLSIAINGKLHFYGATSTDPLVCVIPSGVTELIFSDCNFASVTAFPDGLTNLTVTGCSNVTTLPDFPVGLLTVSLTGTPVTTLPTLPATLTSLGIEGTAIADLSSAVIPATLTNFEAAVLGWDNSKLPDLTGTALVTADLSQNGLSDIPDLPNSVTSLDFHGNTEAFNTPSSLPTNLVVLNMNGCSLADTGDGVTAILSILNNNGKLNGSVDLTGCGAAGDPSIAPLLIAKGWSVIVDS